MKLNTELAVQIERTPIRIGEDWCDAQWRQRDAAQKMRNKAAAKFWTLRAVYSESI